MIKALCFLLFFSFSVQFVSSSKCIVTKWRKWSDCFGNCEFGQRVRNRDVIRPPLPEKNETSKNAISKCPPLYEIEYCTPSECKENPFNIAEPKSEVKSAKTEKLATKAFFRPVLKLNNSRAKASGLVTFKQSRRSNCGLTDRCCQIYRLVCPNGEIPGKVLRWYRQKNESFCRQFYYPFCNDDIEFQENPIYEESDCQELCFTDQEKSLLPSLRLIK